MRVRLVARALGCVCHPAVLTVARARGRLLFGIGGIFAIPGYLTTEARDLLLSMLVVDPLQRITIDKIK